MAADASLVFDFDDSEVAAVLLDGADLRVRFSVARVWRHGEPGYRKAVELLLTQAHVDGGFDDCLGTLSAGQLCIDGRALRPVPLPCSASGAVSLALRFRNRASLSATASAVLLQGADDGPMLADHAC